MSGAVEGVALLPCRAPQADNSLRHGHARHGQESLTWVSWQSMLARCRYLDRDTAAKHIGRGIEVCERWHWFDNFLADMGERPTGMTLDRHPNNNGNYEPGNCRWATPIEQARNRRNARLTFETAVEVAVAMLNGASAKSVSSQYGTSESLPREIRAGRTWKDALARAKEIVVEQ
ncbi:hypothetical protein [Sphingomonas sp. Ant20]|uniref:hypothetical protein n=1 Tax=Sphingomonas sp. Ant20 TaxID=104605 RepID=UPI0018E2FE2B|nr:hypothetical protein [Sphingomonas sp. Ant20]